MHKARRLSAFDKLAILINGSDEFRHEDNIQYVYNTLLKNEYEKENIFVFQQGEIYPRKNDIESFVSSVSADKLFVYVTGHGNRYRGLSKILMPEKNINEIEFESYFNNVDYSIGIFVFVQCYGDAFAERMGKDRNLCISSTDSFRESRGSSFTEQMFKSLRYGSSIKESFDYALKKDRHNLSMINRPQLFTELDANNIYI